MAGLYLSLLLAAGVLAVPAKALVPSAAPHGGDAIQLVQSPKVVVLKANEVHNERIATGSGERLQVLFADGTTIALAPDSEVGIQSFVFDPVTGDARLSATLTRGVFRFIGGRTTRTPGGVTLATPFGTIAIDRAGADLSLGGDGKPAHFDLVFGNSMTLSRDGAVVGRVHQSGYSIVPATGGSIAAVRKTLPEWREYVQNQLS